jgi:RNA polymerase sigma factor (sigma-70 family)
LSLLQKALAGLSPRQKEAVYLKITEELDYLQIAEMMDISVVSCRNLIAKAIKSLKEALHP